MKNKKTMIYPPPVSKGDCIGLAVPASPISREERDVCVEVLEELGFRVKLAEGLKGSCGGGIRGEEEKEKKNVWHPWYLAGEARRRADDLNRMFHDRQVRAVFCVRGGYGSAGILPFLDYRGIRRNPKVFVGYSDITAVHMALQKYSGLVTFHGPMVKSDLITAGLGLHQWKSLWDMIGNDGAMAVRGRVLFRNPDGEEICPLPGMIPKGRAGLQRGIVQGRLSGGNLSVLARLAGTGYLPDMRGRILFLEDVNETVARIHMNLLQLEQIGIFDQVQGVLLGDFTDCGRGTEELMSCFFQHRGLPVLKNICSDHRPDMRTLSLGAICRMHPAKGSLLFIK